VPRMALRYTLTIRGTTMASLLGVPPQNFWRDLFQFPASNNGVTSSLVTIQDGKGTNLPLQISTTTINFTNAVQHNGVGLVSSAGTTGGAGSAGAGNQYVELVIGGTTYKILHDGTV